MMSVSFGNIGMFLASIVIIIVALGASHNIAHADDFVVETQCVNNYLFVTIHNDDDYNPIHDIKIRTIPDLRASKIISTFDANTDGSFILSPKDNTGFAWFSSPGYNDQKISTSCDSIDKISQNKQFENYCHAYISNKMPIYMPEFKEQPSLPSLVEFIGSKLDTKNVLIYEQIQVIRALLDEYNISQSTNSTISAKNYHPSSQSNILCLENIKAANSLMFEIYGMIYAAEEFGIIMPDQDVLVKLAAVKYNLNTTNASWCNVTNHTSDLDREIASAYKIASLLLAQWESQIQESQMLNPVATIMSASMLSNHNYYVSSQNSENYYSTMDSSRNINSNINTTSHFSYDVNNQSFYYDRYNTYANLPYNYDNHNYTDCYTFCDSDDYEPDWARYLTVQDAAEACWDVEADSDRIGTDDWYWCKELERHINYDD